MQARVAAQDLFDQAIALMDRKEYDAACPKIEEVIRLQPSGVGAKLALADCFERQGRLASAWTSYVIAETAAETAGQAERQKKAHEKATALKPMLSQVTITVAPDANIAGLVIMRDGSPIGTPQWGVPVAIDGGKHTIAASAPGRKGWSTTIDVAPSKDSANVAIPLLQSESAESPPSSRVGAREPAPLPPVAPPEVPMQKMLGFAAIGAGAIGIGIGAGAGIAAMGKHSNLAATCPDHVCTNQGDAIHSYMTMTSLSTAGFVVGGVLAATGVVLLFTAPKPRSMRQASIAPILGVGFVGAKGAF
jgi:hypothetical protein